MRKHLPYHLGFIIPSLLISVLGIGTYFCILIDDELSARLWFIAGWLYIWYTYLMAIISDPGRVDPEKCKQEGSLSSFCSKCKQLKPERAHHCRQCGRCVLRMDHHCPWTYNCIGHANLPHFIRFLFSVVVVTSYGLYRTLGWNWSMWRNRNLPAYLVSTQKIVIGMLLVPFQFFVLATLTILFLRVLIDAAQGQTQIEVWEQDRVRALIRRRLVSRRPDPFPFDLGSPFSNLSQMLGGTLAWALPWVNCPGDGHIFPKAFKTKNRWPPVESAESQAHEYYRIDRWRGNDGENLADYGVDVECDSNDYPGGGSIDGSIDGSNDGFNDEDVPLNTVIERLQAEKVTWHT